MSNSQTISPPQIRAGTSGQVLVTLSGSAQWGGSPIVVGFQIASGLTGTNVASMQPAARSGVFSRLVVVTKTSDATTALTFNVIRNGTSILTAPNTISAATSSGTVNIFTNFTSNPFAVTQDDIFSLNITSGTASWAVTIQMET